MNDEGRRKKEEGRKRVQLQGCKLRVGAFGL
jgi:hypothetical protein